jgi:mannitol/fructose-specific phosphotransferase system IIA component (Ntr-type)
MDITQLLPREHIVLEAAGADRSDLLRCLLVPLVQDGTIADGEAFLAELELRERQVTTQVPGGVAFPHARSRCVRRLGLVVGTAAAPGVAFAGPGAESCRLFFLIAVPTSAPTAHLPLLRHLSALVRQPARVERLVEARTASQLARIMAARRA